MACRAEASSEGRMTRMRTDFSKRKNPPRSRPRIIHGVAGRAKQESPCPQPVLKESERSDARRKDGLRTRAAGSLFAFEKHQQLIHRHAPSFIRDVLDTFRQSKLTATQAADRHSRESPCIMSVSTGSNRCARSVRRVAGATRKRFFRQALRVWRPGDRRWPRKSLRSTRWARVKGCASRGGKHSTLNVEQPTSNSEPRSRLADKAVRAPEATFRRFGFLELHLTAAVRRLS